MGELTDQQKEIIQNQKNKFSLVITDNFMQIIFKASTSYLLSKIRPE